MYFDTLFGKDEQAVMKASEQVTPDKRQIKGQIKALHLGHLPLTHKAPGWDTHTHTRSQHAINVIVHV